MSSRSPTSAFNRSVSVSMVARNTCRSSSVHETSCCMRLVTDAFTEASGVRRSWETARSSAVRKASASASDSAATALACSRRLSRAIASCETNVRSRRSSSACTVPPSTTKTVSGPTVRSQVASSNGVSGGVSPLDAISVQVSAARLSKETEPNEKVARIWSMSWTIGSGSPSSVAVVRARTSASARARSASRERAALRST